MADSRSSSVRAPPEQHGCLAVLTSGCRASRDCERGMQRGGRTGTHRPRGDMGSGIRLTGRPDTEHATAMVPTMMPTMDQALLLSRV